MYCKIKILNVIYTDWKISPKIFMTLVYSNGAVSNRWRKMSQKSFPGELLKYWFSYPQQQKQCKALSLKSVYLPHSLNPPQSIWVRWVGECCIVVLPYHRTSRSPIARSRTIRCSDTVDKPEPAFCQKLVWSQQSERSHKIYKGPFHIDLKRYR